MIDLTLRVLVVSALAVILLGATFRASASVRHLVALAGLASVLLLTVFGWALPPVAIPILPVASPEVQTAVTMGAMATRGPVVEERVPTPTVRVERAPPWKALWLLGVGLMLARWMGGFLWLRRRLRRAERVEGLDAPLPVVESDAFGIPVVAWTPRACIVLPPGWREWPAERLDVVLHHETAHVQRGDGMGMLVSRLAVALLWPNPLVWILARAEARLAERATDDLVIGGGLPAVRYAHELLALARNLPASGFLPALGMARPAALSHRVEMILRTDLPRTPVASRARLGAALAALTFSLPVALAAVGPQAPPASAAPPMSVAVTAIANPIAFRLRCKVVRATGLGEPSPKGSRAEPAIGQSNPANVVNAPDVYTGDGVPAALKVTVGGVVHMVEIRPDTGDDFRCVVNLSERTNVKGQPMGYNMRWYQTRANEWLRYPLMSYSEKPTAYQVLVQVTPYKGDGPAPETPRMSASPSAPTAPPRTVPLPLAEGPTEPQAIPPATAPQRTGNPIVGKAPQQILLKCKIVHTAGGSVDGVSVSKSEPLEDAQANVRLVSAPTIRTLDGQEASISAMTDDDIVGARLLAKVIGPNRYRLGVQAFASEGGASAPHGFSDPNFKPRMVLRGVVQVDANGWVRFRLLDHSGKDRGYQMLVQVLPVAG